MESLPRVYLTRLRLRSGVKPIGRTKVSIPLFLCEHELGEIFSNFVGELRNERSIFESVKKIFHA